MKKQQEERLRQMREDSLEFVAEYNFTDALLQSLSMDPAFVKVRELDLDFEAGEIVDLTRVNTFSELQDLVMVGVSGTVGAISPAELQSLKKIEIYNWHEIRDLSCLASSNGPIEKLVIYHCPLLASLSGVTKLESLTNLTIHNCQGLTDISAAAALPRLKELWISEAPQLVDILPLAQSHSLESLSLPSNGIFSPEDLAEVRRLLPSCEIFPGQ